MSSIGRDGSIATECLHVQVDVSKAIPMQVSV